jgi:hypothetical protein
VRPSGIVAACAPPLRNVCSDGRHEVMLPRSNNVTSV